MIATTENIDASAGIDSQAAYASADEYHSDYTRISASMLKTWMRSRREYEATYVTCKKEPDKPSKIMTFGSVVHAVFLEGKDLGNITMTYPSWCLSKAGGLVATHTSAVDVIVDRIRDGESFGDFVHTYPPGCITAAGNISEANAKKFRKTIPKEAVLLRSEDADELAELLDGRDEMPEYMMKTEDLRRAGRVIEKIKEHPVYAQWMQHPNVLTEEMIQWVHEPSGLPCRSMLDMVIPGARAAIILDLKLSAYWHPDAFAGYMCGNRRGGQRGWLQSCFYASAVAWKYKVPAMMKFLAVNPEEPHQAVMHSMSQQTFDESQSVMDEEMRKLAKAIETGDFSDPYEKVDNPVTLSQWEIV
ncbi:MAG: PD-(D/E)XK nuclease-like domain-containing protein [Planctomycetota bacterium]